MHARTHTHTHVVMVDTDRHMIGAKLSDLRLVTLDIESTHEHSKMMGLGAYMFRIVLATYHIPLTEHHQSKCAPGRTHE